MHIERSGNGGSLVVQITNHGLRAVRAVPLVDAAPQEADPWRSWKSNLNVGRQLSTTCWPLLHAGSDITAALWLLGENGTHTPRLPAKAAWGSTFATTKVSGGRLGPAERLLASTRLPLRKRRQGRCPALLTWDDLHVAAQTLEPPLWPLIVAGTPRGHPRHGELRRRGRTRRTQLPTARPQLCNDSSTPH
jgi:hypothetical protein